MKKKRYLVEVEEMTKVIGGMPRIANTRIPLFQLGKYGLLVFRRNWPYVKKQIMELK